MHVHDGTESQPARERGVASASQALIREQATHDLRRLAQHLEDRWAALSASSQATPIEELADFRAVCERVIQEVKTDHGARRLSDESALPVLAALERVLQAVHTRAPDTCSDISPARNVGLPAHMG